MCIILKWKIKENILSSTFSILGMLIVSYFTAKQLTKLRLFDFLFARSGRSEAIDGLHGYFF